jgi:hypothetical protein
MIAMTTALIGNADMQGGDFSLEINEKYHELPMEEIEPAF